jgi:hypothetical protein
MNNNATEMWLKTAENMFERMAMGDSATLQDVLPRPCIPHTHASEVKVATQGAETMQAVAAELRTQRDMLRVLRTSIEVRGRNEY